MVMSLIESLTKIKNAVYGREVREAIHDGVFRANQIADGADAKANQTQIRQDAVEDFNTQVIQEMTDRDVISAPEIIAARGGKPTLQARLDETTAQLTEIAINAESFGVVTNDTSIDNKNAINEAIVYAHSLGGGNVLLPEGVIYISAGIRVKDNVNLVGVKGKTTLKVLSTVKDFYSLITLTHSSNCKIEGISIDCNYDNRTDYDLTLEPQIILALANSHNIEITNNKIVGCGVWVIAAHSSVSVDYSTNVKITNNEITWKSGLSSQKPSLPTGVLIDNTAIYLDAIGYVVDNNIIKTSDSLKTMTAIEPHCANGTVSNNIIDGFRTGLIITSLTQREYPLHSNNMVIVNNNINECETGMRLLSFFNHNLNGCLINGNEINVNTIKYNRALGVGITIESDQNTLSTKIKNVRIVNNTLIFSDDLRPFSDHFTTAEFYGIGLVSGSLENIAIEQNTIINSPSIGLLISSKSGWSGSIDNVTVSGNTIIDAGKNININTNIGYGRSAIRVYSSILMPIKRLILAENFIYDTRTSGTYYTHVIQTSGISDSNVTISDQKLVTTAIKNLYDKQSFTTSLKFDSQVGTVDYTQNCFYYVQGDLCKVFYQIDVSSFNVTQGYGCHIVLPIEPSVDFVGGNFLVSTSEKGQYALTLTNGNKNAYFKTPATLTSSGFGNSTKISGVIEYPIGLTKKYSI